MAQKFLNGIDVSSTTVVNGSNLNSGSTVLDVQGSQGQLFSVTNSLTGDLFSVSDVSGVPILNVNSSGLINIDGKLGINNDSPAFGLDIDLDSVNDRINITAGGAQKAIINGYGNIIAYGSLTSYGNSLGGGGGIFTYKGGTATQTIGHRFQHVSGNFTGSSGDQTMMQINPTINQTSSAGYTGIKLNVTETATGSGTKNLLDLQVGGTSKASISNAGNATFAGKITSGNDIVNATAGVYTWTGDTDTYIQRSAANEITFKTLALNALVLDASQNATFAGNVSLTGGTSKKLSITASQHDTNTANTSTLELGFGHSGGTGVGNIVLTEDANNSFGADMTFGVPHNNGSGGSSTRTALTLDGGTLNATFTGSVTATTINTGQGATEVYLMNQNVRTSDNVQFADLTLTGNLNVYGDINTQNVTNLDVVDKTITVAKGAADSAAADGAGIVVDGASASLLYDHTGTQWEFNKPVDVKVGSSAITMTEYGNGATIWLDGVNGDFIGGDYFGIHAYSNTSLDFSYGAATKMSMTNAGVLTTTGLDINGNADISGNITNATWAGDIIAEAKLQNQSGTNTGDNSANTHSSMFIDRGDVNVTTTSGGSNSNPFDNAHTETKIAENGARSISYTGASAHLFTSYVGGSASVLQLGAHYNGDDFYMRVRTDGSSWKNWRKVHHDNYHPNADTLTTARTLTIGSTGITFNGAADVTWTLSEIGAQAAGNYLTSDTNYLKSNANDDFSGTLTGTGTAENLKVGGIRGTTKGSQTGQYIHLYERVHIGGPSGWGHSTHGAPSAGLSTWGSVDFGMNGSGVIQLDGTTIVTAARALTNIGTIGSGAITSTGKIQGTELEGTSLDINGNGDISGNLTVDGTTYGIYHAVVDDQYYFDDYNGSKNLNLFYKNTRSDILRYRQVDNYEYWNGSAWVADSSKLSSVKNLLDGRQDTSYSIPSRDYKFRFTTSLASAWPTMAMIWMQTSWTGSTYPGGTMTVEHYISGSWTTKVTADFTNANGVGNWGTAARADTALHDGNGSGTNTTRITIDFYGWTPSNSSYVTIPLQNLMITSNFSGTENTDYTNLLDYDRNVTIAGNLVMGAGKTVDGVDISALPTSFAPVTAEQNVQSDWNATSGDALILNKPSIPAAVTDYVSKANGGTFNGPISISDSAGAAWLSAMTNSANNGHGLLIQAGGTSGTRYITQWKDAAGTERFHMDDTGEAYFQNSITSSNFSGSSSGTNTGDQVTFDSTANLTSPSASTGTWTNGSATDWGTPKIGTSLARFNDGTGTLSFTVPTGMKTAYISHLTWSSGGYMDVYGVQSDGGEVFLRRINTKQTVENTNEGNPNQHDGTTIAFAGHIGDFPTILLHNKVGRVHLTGLGFSKSELAASDGTGIVNYSQLTGTVPTWNQNTTGNADTATLAANSTLAGGLAVGTGVNNSANQIVRTDANGYTHFGWINSISGATTSTITRITASNDQYLRYVTPATFRSQIIAPYFATSAQGTTADNALPKAGGTMTGNIHCTDPSTAGTSAKVQFGTNTSWNNSIGLAAYWMRLGCNQNEGFKFEDSVGNMLLQLHGGNSSSGNGVFSATFKGSINVNTNGLIKYEENTDVDSSSAEAVASVVKATYTAAFFDYVIKKGANVRSGIVTACHDGTNVEYAETSTVDLGDTSDVVLSVDISGVYMRLIATAASNDWTIKTLIRAI